MGLNNFFHNSLGQYAKIVSWDHFISIWWKLVGRIAHSIKIRKGIFLQAYFEAKLCCNNAAAAAAALSAWNCVVDRLLLQRSSFLTAVKKFQKSWSISKKKIFSLSHTKLFRIRTRSELGTPTLIKYTTGDGENNLPPICREPVDRERRSGRATEFVERLPTRQSRCRKTRESRVMRDFLPLPRPRRVPHNETRNRLRKGIKRRRTGMMLSFLFS